MRVCLHNIITIYSLLYQARYLAVENMLFVVIYNGKSDITPSRLKIFKHTFLNKNNNKISFFLSYPLSFSFLYPFLHIINEMRFSWSFFLIIQSHEKQKPWTEDCFYFEIRLVEWTVTWISRITRNLGYNLTLRLSMN